MFKPLFMLGAMALLSASPFAFAGEQAEMEQKCKQWAQEEQVDSQDLAEYVADCVKSLSEESAQ